MESKIRKSDYFKKNPMLTQIPKLTDEKRELVDSMIKKIDELLEE